jgi:hypothetical protein
MAQTIVGDLEAALKQLREIAADLRNDAMKDALERNDERMKAWKNSNVRLTPFISAMI